MNADILELSQRHVTCRTSQKKIKWQSVSSLEGYIATNGTDLTSPSSIGCSLECQSVSTCIAFFYTSNQANLNCQLHDQKFDGTIGLINVGNAKYYVKQENASSSNASYCDDLYQNGYNVSGVYTIQTTDGEGLSVRCEMSPDTGGWIVFQQRLNDSDFYKTWDEYKTGFGDLNGNFWLGNENLWTLTKTGSWKLRVELTYGNESGYAEYSFFSVSDEASFYYLSVGGYSGNIGDSLYLQNGYRFSTKDRDFDTFYVGSCAQSFHGAWWYSNCHLSNLNGEYGNNEYGKGITWESWKTQEVSLTTSKMMIKQN
ncbi:hypothetical protein ACF0H5_014868 [Mactra antiquata]